MNNKKAYWTQLTHIFKADEYICSFCRYKADKAYKICPNCSSEMKKTKYDANWVDEMSLFDDFFDD